MSLDSRDALDIAATEFGTAPPSETSMNSFQAAFHFEGAPDSRVSPIVTGFPRQHRPPHQQPVIGYGDLPVLLPPFEFSDFRRRTRHGQGPRLECKAEFPELGAVSRKSSSQPPSTNRVNNSPSCFLLCANSTRNRPLWKY